MDDPDARRLVRSWLAMFNDGDTTLAEHLVAARFGEHARAPFGDEAPEEVDGPRHLRDAVTWLRAQYPDLVMEPEAIAVEGGLVALRVRSTGTNLGPVAPGVPPTGRRFDARQSHWFRVAEGRLCEHWATRDDLTAMLQLGLVVPAGAAGAARHD